MNAGSCAMLSNEVAFNRSGVVIVMSDIAILTASAKTTLLDIGKQASLLGVGLSNAAPGDKTGAPNNSIQYLLGMADTIGTCTKDCDALLKSMSPDGNHYKSGM